MNQPTSQSSQGPIGAVGGADRAGEPISGNLPLCAFLQKHHLFKGLDRGDTDHLCRVGRLVRLKIGEFVIREGDKSDDLYLIVNGTVHVQTDSRSGPVNLGSLTRNAFFGEVACLTGRPRTATVTAQGDVELIALSRPDVDGILKKYPKVRKLLQAVMAGRARDVIEKSRGPA